MVLFLALPILGAPGERLFGNEIVGRFHDPYSVALHYEQPLTLTPYTQLATDWTGTLLARLVGGVAAVNLLVLASFPLTAWTTYLLAHKLTASRLAATSSAFLFAFSPFHLAHAGYHPHIAQMEWLPLYLLALVLALERPSKGRLALLLGSLGLVAFSNYYFGLVALVVAPFAMGAVWSSGRRTGDAAPGALARIAGAHALALVAGLGFVAVAAPGVLSDRSKLAFPGSDLAKYTALPESYLVPPLEHPVLGGIASGHWDRLGYGAARLEQQLFVGGAALLLAIAGLVLSDRRGVAARRLGVTLIVVGFLCALSPAWSPAGFDLPSVSAWIHAAMPMFRALARFGVLVVLGVALLAGMGLDRLWRRGGLVRGMAVPGLMALLLFELAPWPPFRGRDVLPTAAHRWLAELATAGPTLDCVAGSDPGQRSALAFYPHRLRLLGPFEDCAEPGLAARLRASGVERVLVRMGDRFGAWFAGRAAPDGWRLERSFADSRLYVLDAAPGTLWIERLGGFHALELAGEGAFRWLDGTGRLALINRSNEPRRVRVTLRLHAFPTPRTVSVVLGAGPPERIDVGIAPAEVVLAPAWVRPGRSSIVVRSGSPPVVADEVLGNGDRRTLAIALWSWTVEEDLDTASDG